MRGFRTGLIEGPLGLCGPLHRSFSLTVTRWLPGPLRPPCSHWSRKRQLAQQLSLQTEKALSQKAPGQKGLDASPVSSPLRPKVKFTRGL